MKTIELKLYSFDELSDEAKEKAIERCSDFNIDYDWYQFTYDDAEEIGLKITGFDIDLGSYCHGHFLQSAIETADLIIKSHGEDCETFKTAKNYLQERDNLVFKYSDGKNIEIVTEDNEYDFDSECDELDDEFLNSLCEDYRIILSNEYDYQTSREAIIETIHANDYEFTEDGKIY